MLSGASGFSVFSHSRMGRRAPPVRESFVSSVGVTSSGIIVSGSSKSFSAKVGETGSPYRVFKRF